MDGILMVVVHNIIMLHPKTYAGLSKKSYVTRKQELFINFFTPKYLSLKNVNAQGLQVGRASAIPKIGGV